MVTASYEQFCRGARQAMAQGRVDEARGMFEQALGLRPSSPDAHYGLALASFVLNDLQNAAYHFKESARLDPLRAGAYINLGAVLTRLDEHAEAARVLRQAIKIDPKRVEAYYNLALVYRSIGDIDRAIEAYREALRLDPHHADAHYNLGNIYKEREEFEEAAEHYRKALELQPGWDKAERGLAQAEAVLEALGPGAQEEQEEEEEEEAAAEPAPEPPPRVESSKDDTKHDMPRVPLANPERRLDPDRHGAQLEAMHEATKAAQASGAEFLQAIQNELEPTVHALAKTLIGRQPGIYANVEPLMERFEKALAHFRQAHDDLQAHLRRAQRAGDKILST